MKNIDRSYGYIFLGTLIVGILAVLMAVAGEVNPHTLEVDPDVDANALRGFIVFCVVGSVISILRAYYNVVKRDDKLKKLVLPVRIFSAIIIAVSFTAKALIDLYKSAKAEQQQ